MRCWLVDLGDMRNCDLIGLVGPNEMPSPVEPQYEDRRVSGNLADFDALQTHVLDGAREVNKSRQPSESERRKHKSPTCLMFRGVPSVAERA